MEVEIGSDNEVTWIIITFFAGLVEHYARGEDLWHILSIVLS